MAKKTRFRINKTNARKRKMTMKGGFFGFGPSENRKRFEALSKSPNEIPGFNFKDYTEFTSQYPTQDQRYRALRAFEMNRGNFGVTAVGSSVARGINDTAESVSRGMDRWATTPNSGPFGNRGKGPQNEGGLTVFTRGLRRGITDLMGNRNAKTRKSSFTNISRINTNTVASIAAKIDALLIHLGVPYLFTDKTYATNYIISRFNPASQSNDGRGFLRLTEEQIRQIANYVDKSFGPTQNEKFNEGLLKDKMNECQQKLETLKQQINLSSTINSGFGSVTGSAGGLTSVVSGLFGSSQGSSSAQQLPISSSMSNQDVSLLVQYMVVSTMFSFMVDKLEKETGQGTFEIDPNILSAMIEQQISTQIDTFLPVGPVNPIQSTSGGIELTGMPTGGPRYTALATN